jgi:hypothetical protein
VRVRIHYVGWLEAMLEDKIEHGLDHLQFGVEDRGRAGVGDDVAQASAVDAELLEEIVLVTLFHGRSPSRRHSISLSTQTWRPTP